MLTDPFFSGQSPTYRRSSFLVARDGVGLPFFFLLREWTFFLLSHQQNYALPTSFPTSFSFFFACSQLKGTAFFSFESRNSENRDVKLIVFSSSSCLKVSARASENGEAPPLFSLLKELTQIFVPPYRDIHQRDGELDTVSLSFPFFVPPLPLLALCWEKSGHPPLNHIYPVLIVLGKC